MFNFYLYKNDVFKTSINPWKAKLSENIQNVSGIDSASVEHIISEMKKYPKEIIIRETSIPNVCSFNFSRDIFFKGKWNNLSKIARGLFINTASNEIVARGYDKFFNLEERQFNTLS